MGQNARSARREDRTKGQKARKMMQKSSVKRVPKPKKNTGGK